MERKGFGPRLGAAIIDAVIVVIISGVVGLICGAGFSVHFGGMGSTPKDVTDVSKWIAAMRLTAIIGGLAGLAYASTEIFMAATPGKMILKMKIARADGAPADQATLIKRFVLKHCPEIAGLLIAIVGLWSLGFIQQLLGLAVFVSCLMCLRATKLALHDDLAGTSVVGPATSVVPQGFPVVTTGAGQTPPPPPQA